MSYNTKQAKLKMPIPDIYTLPSQSTHKKNILKDKAVTNMTRHAFDKMMNELCSRPAETGGLLLGPVESNDVSDFYFDTGGTVTGASYSPDFKTLNRKLITEWIPAGFDYKGIAHSHPGILDELTQKDLLYIRRLLAANPDMPLFIAPIIIPPAFRMRTMVIYRDNPNVAIEARINFY